MKNGGINSKMTPKAGKNLHSDDISTIFVS